MEVWEWKPRKAVRKLEDVFAGFLADQFSFPWWIPRTRQGLHKPWDVVHLLGKLGPAEFISKLLLGVVSPQSNIYGGSF